MGDPARLCPVPCPCARVCCMDHKGVCRGCGLTKREVSRWADLSWEQKRGVVAAAELRRQRA